jgi:hypothetical protein
LLLIGLAGENTQQRITLPMVVISAKAAFRAAVILGPVKSATTGREK